MTVGLISFACSPATPTNIFSPSVALNTDDGNANISLRTIATLSSNSLGKIQVTIAASSLGGTRNVAHVSMGKWDGGAAAGCTTAPVEITFGGLSGFSILQGTSVTSDIIDHSGTFSILSGNGLVVVIDDGSPSAQRLSSGNTNVTTWFATGTSWNLQAPAGFTQSVNNDFGLSLIATSSSAPVVSSTSYNFGVPAESSQAVGQVTATNSPTSWSITAGNSSGLFAIDNSGNITANANLTPYSSYSTGVQATTYNLTVQATGSGGSGSGSITIVGSNLPWPALSNRPSISGSTLTWTGPTSGGPSRWDDSAQSHALTTHSGDFTTSSNGQVVQYQDITGNFILQHSNVTLSRCRIQGVIFPFSVPSGSNGFVIEDCDLIGVDGDATPLFVGNGSGAIINTKMRRCASHDVENNLTAYSLGVIVKDSIFYNVNGGDSDQYELYTTDSAHNNGVGPTNSVTLCNNTYQGPLISGIYNSAINLTNGNSGPVGWPTTLSIGPNIYIDHNFFNDCAPVTGHIINDDNTKGSGYIQWNATNNGFYRTASQSYRIGSSTVLTNSGNFNMATAGTFTGTATNGTGAI